MRPSSATTLKLGSIIVGLMCGCDPAIRDAVQPKTSLSIVFCDVTSSLNLDELKNVASLTADLVESLPPGTRYEIYPIQRVTDRVAALTMGSIPFAQGQSDRIQVERGLAALRLQIGKLMDSLYVKVNKPQQVDNRTCLINSLWLASSIIRQHRLRAQTERIDIYYVSDMLEECDNNVAGESIDLVGRKPLEGELKKADKLNLELRLVDVNIAVIVPVAQSSSDHFHPNQHQLEAFWKTVLTKAGWTREELDNPNRFSWNVGQLPLRLQPDATGSVR